MAGTGKSTVASTVARNFAEQKRLGASFFFSRGGGDLGYATKFFTTLAIQLAKLSPALKAYICQAISEHSDIAQQALHEQWKQLILRPLSMLKGGQLQPPNLVLVIDALDECEPEDDVRVIIRLLAQAKDLNTAKLQIFVTSRPETPIRLGFRTIPEAIHQDFVLHNISQPIIQRDISFFLNHNLKKIREEHALSTDWPGEKNIQLLVQRADGLFIYAATACRFIGHPKMLPEERLSQVLEGNAPGQSPTQKLDEMYTTVLTYSVIGDCDKQEKGILCERFRQIVGSIVILFEPLSPAALTELLPIQARLIDKTLNPLRSVLNVSENRNSPIRLLHPSFRDFLLDQRCLDDQFRISGKKAHSDLAESCLKVMSNGLKRDICRLRMPGALTSEVESSDIVRYLPISVLYACRYWVDHLQRGDISLCGDNGQVHIFFQEHFLHWLEALSLIGKLPEGVLMLTALQSMLTVGDSVIYHSYRFS
jgi:hypothetical protein